MSEEMAQSLFNTQSIDSQFFDDDDIFQCGRCKKQFRSLDLFVLHKREECQRPIEFKENDRDDNSHKSVLDISSSFLSHQHHHHHHQGHHHQMHPEMTSVVDENSESSLIPNISSSPDSTLINVMNNSSILHLTPSMVLTDDSVSFSIPVDQHGCLAHIVAHGQNSQLPHGLLFTIPSSSEKTPSIQLELPGLEFTENAKENHQEFDSNSVPGDSDSIDTSHHQLNSSLETSVISQNIDYEPPEMEQSDSVGEVEESTYGNSVTPEPGPLESTVNMADVVENVETVESASTMRASREIERMEDKALRQRLSSEASNSTSKKCDYCGKLFKKVFNLHQHIRSHTGEKPFHCLVCGRGFTQKSNVKKHMQTHKVWPKLKVTLPKEQISVKIRSTDNKPEDQQEQDSPLRSDQVEYVVNNVYVCQYCNESFENHHKLKTHMIIHKSEKLFKCVHKDCAATFVDVEGLICHVKSHEDEMEYRCQQCPKIFKNLYDLGTHQFSHRLYPNKVSSTASNRSFRCSKCNNKYATSEALNHHLLTSSHNYPCSHCQLEFVCERYLRRHLKIHGTGAPFQCGQCGKLFKTENYLKSHLVIHSDNKPYECDICGALFNRRDKMTRHRRIHENRKYKCPFTAQTGCDREFYRKDKLKDHMLSHSRKSYLCSKCGKSFSWPTRLRHHLVEHHPEMLTSTTCSTCHKIFKTKHHLKIHLCKGPQTDTTKAKTTRRGKAKPSNVNYAEDEVSLEDEEEDVIYRDCDIVVKCEGGDKEESVILNGLTSAHNDHQRPGSSSNQYSDSNDNVDDVSHVVLGTMDIAFETNVDSTSLDPLMAGD